MAEKIRSADPVSQRQIELACRKGLQIAWDRYDAMQPQCGFGTLGLCCTVCNMGPCRIDPFGNGPQRGICGATADTIAARNLAQKICLLYISDAADEGLGVDLGGRRIIKTAINITR